MKIFFLVVLAGLSAPAVAQRAGAGQTGPPAQERNERGDSRLAPQKQTQPQAQSTSVPRANAGTPAPTSGPKPKAKPTSSAKPASQANLGSAQRRALLEKRGTTRAKPASGKS